MGQRFQKVGRSNFEKSKQVKYVSYHFQYNLDFCLIFLFYSMTTVNGEKAVLSVTRSHVKGLTATRRAVPYERGLRHQQSEVLPLSKSAAKCRRLTAKN